MTDDIESICDEWRDEERMGFMFGKLRHKELNPVSWQSKVSFWTKLIEKWCSREQKSSFRLSELKVAFQRDGRSPECLEDILVEGEKSGMFMETGRYIAWLQSKDSWGSWVKSMSWLAAQSLKVQLVGSSSSQFTVPSLAEDLAMKMLTQIRDTQPFISTDGSKFLLKEGLFTNNEDKNQIFEFLRMRKVVEVCSVNNVEFVKVPLMRDSKVVVEDGDIVLIKIQQTLNSLDEETEKLETEINHLDDKIKQLLKSNSRTAAKNMLRKRKMLEKRMQERFSQKLNVETVFDELVNVSSHKKVIESYKSGLGELKLRMEELNSENVDEMLADIRDTLKEAEDISGALSSSILSDSCFDAADLEKELNDLSSIENSLNCPSEEEKLLLDALEKLEVVDLEPQIGKPAAKKKEVSEMSN